MNAKLNGLLVALCAAGAVPAVAEESDTPVVPEVSEVTMKQTSSRTVTITYKLSNAPAVVTLDIQTNAANGAWVSIGGKNIQNFSAASDVFRQVSAKDTYTIKWHPDLSWSGHKIENGGARAVVTAWALDNTPDYMVIDLTTATPTDKTVRYYPAEDFLPGGLLDNPMYRTSALVMRKIMAKNVTWTMGSSALEEGSDQGWEAQHTVTLDHNYYIGVFPVTQAQWTLVQPGKPTDADGTGSLQPWFTNVAARAMRPMEYVCYNEIRNASLTKTADTQYDWPHDPNPDSFLGKLKTKSGIKFDLPGEAEWEFACRAGTGDNCWGDGTAFSADADMGMPGRCSGNVPTVIDPNTTGLRGFDGTGGTAVVGSFAPNLWGIYDMHGNVREWCLDWVGGNTISELNGEVNIDLTDPTKRRSSPAATGSARMLRGGRWNDPATSCRSAYRSNGGAGGAVPTSRSSTIGFRLCTHAELK